MAIVLHKITPTAADAPGVYRLDIEIDAVPSTFNAAVSPDSSSGGCDPELFFLLSERGLAERGNSAQYHADLYLLVRDAHRGAQVKLPFIFGTHRRFPTGSRYSRHPWWRRLAFWRHSAGME